MHGTNDVSRIERAKATFALVDNAMTMQDQRRGRFTITNALLESRIRSRNNASDDALHERIAELEAQLAEKEAIIQRLVRDTDTDALTGVLNRGGFDRHLQSEWNRASNANQQLAVIFVDLDNFKQINDTYDHSVGDLALTAVGTQLIRCLRRSGELVGRYGGDEFVAIVPNATLQDAAMLAERMRASIEAMDVRAGQRLVKITTSIGVATLGTTVPQATPQLLVQKADLAAKAAKENGRNQTVADHEGGFAVVQGGRGSAPARAIAKGGRA
jgi:diguanylate cyclase (GGDEF)-like protein